MLTTLRCRRIWKLLMLISCHTLIVTVVLTPVRIIFLMELPKEQDTNTNTEFIQDSSSILDIAQNETKTFPANILNISVSREIDPIVKSKLEKLYELVPVLSNWYNEGLKTNPPQPLAEMKRDPVCALFRKEATIKRHVVLNVFNDEYPAQNNSDVTLATQGTISRILPLVMAAKYWPGPMQVALHLAKEDLINLTTTFADKDFQTHVLGRRNIIINFIVKTGNFYPINYLRNVVLNNTRTPWILITDIDFVPGKEVYQTALELLKNHEAEKHSKVYVVPAFSGLVDNLSPFPQNKTQLMEVWKKNQIEQTQKTSAGQRYTDYKRWPSSKVPYKVKWSTDYEPYIIGPTNTLPRYDEYFLQRILDKCAQIMETAAKGFEFWVVPNVFMIHIKHERRPGQEYHAGCAHSYYHKEFKVKVRKRYPAQSKRVNKKNS